MNTKEEIIQYLEKKYDNVYKEYTIASEKGSTFLIIAGKEAIMRQILKEIRR